MENTKTNPHAHNKESHHPIDRPHFVIKSVSKKTPTLTPTPTPAPTPTLVENRPGLKHPCGLPLFFGLPEYLLMADPYPHCKHSYRVPYLPYPLGSLFVPQ